MIGMKNMTNSCSSQKACDTDTTEAFHWRDIDKWQQSAKNTAWCLLGCAIGDLGAILTFQLYAPQTPVYIVMIVAILCGISTSIALETVILVKQMPLKLAFKTAVGMSLISMVGMELVMNLTDLWLVGGAKLVWWVLPPMLIAGFLTAWPYNYWRLKKLGKACH